MVADDTPSATERTTELARLWRVTIEESLETPSSLITYGRRNDRRVVLKVVKRPCDEWRSGDVLRAFDGRGVVRVDEHIDGAVLLERLDPGTSLAELACADRDEEATAILADVIASMSPGDPPRGCPTVADWPDSFTRYLATGDAQVPSPLVRRADLIYRTLCESQRETRLLHGDLQHYNVLRDRERGWVVIDPKGVVGELEYEIGASLRNPSERPDVYTDSATIEKRIRVVSSRLTLDVGRVTRWAFAQAVLSLIWGVEEGYTIVPDNPMFALVAALDPMIAKAR
jgi:streptomycin 6-kinase